MLNMHNFIKIYYIVVKLQIISYSIIKTARLTSFVAKDFNLSEPLPEMSDGGAIQCIHV